MLVTIFINIKQFLPYIGISGVSAILPKYGLFLDILASKSYICHKISYPFSTYIINRENVIDILFDNSIQYREYSSSYKAFGGILIVIPEEILKYIENSDGTINIDNIINGNIFKYSIGHCIIRAKQFEDYKYKCGIYDVCMHQKYDSSEMFKSILIKIFSILPDDSILWLAVDPLNSKFYNAIGLYTKFGFKNPYFTFSDPFGKTFYDFKDGIISLTRYNDYNGLEVVDRNIVILEIIYSLQQQIYFLKTTPESSTCSLNLFFNIETAEYLRNLSLYSSTFNIKEKSITTKEISGSLKIVPFSSENKPNVNTNILWEILADGNKKTFGTELNVFLYPGRYNFHTHPKNSYKLVGIEVGIPSGLDYGAFLSSIYTDDIILHCVISFEGIYTISLNKPWTEKSMFNKLYNGFITPILKEKDSIFYKKIFIEIFQLNNNLFINKEKEYCDKINSMTLPIDILTIVTDNVLKNNIAKIPIFNVNFLNYNEINNKKIFSIHFHRRGEPLQCFVNKESIKNYDDNSINNKDEIMTEEIEKDIELDMI